VAYAKAIDFWFGCNVAKQMNFSSNESPLFPACMFFVFLSLVEFAAVGIKMNGMGKFVKFWNFFSTGEFVYAGSRKIRKIGKL
jgi:hypothetical protein